MTDFRFFLDLANMHKVTFPITYDASKHFSHISKRFYDSRNKNQSKNNISAEHKKIAMDNGDRCFHTVLTLT